MNHFEVMLAVSLLTALGSVVAAVVAARKSKQNQYKLLVKDLEIERLRIEADDLRRRLSSGQWPIET